MLMGIDEGRHDYSTSSVNELGTAILLPELRSPDLENHTAVNYYSTVLYEGLGFITGNNFTVSYD